MNKIKDFVGYLLVTAAFLFIGSGMLEAVILKLLELVGW